MKRNFSDTQEKKENFIPNLKITITKKGISRYNTNLINMESLGLNKSEKCGCNLTATKRINKTASTNQISKFQRPTSLNVWSKISLLALVLIMTQLVLSIGQVDARSTTMRPRQLRKRHSNMNPNLDWENPCGGHHIEDASRIGQKAAQNKSIELLRELTEDIYYTINATASHQQEIKIHDMATWSNHNSSYQFLPKLNNGSKVPLIRWHRRMQIYVASFSFLHNKSRKYDEAKNNNRESATSKELKDLLLDARQVLCEIESSINNTADHSRGKKLISRLTPDAMNKLLKFATKKRPSGSEVDTIDLKYVKYYFIEFLKNMLEIIKQRNMRKYNDGSSLSVSESDNVSGSSALENSNEIDASRYARRHNLNSKEHRHGGKHRHGSSSSSKEHRNGSSSKEHRNGNGSSSKERRNRRKNQERRNRQKKLRQRSKKTNSTPSIIFQANHY